MNKNTKKLIAGMLMMVLMVAMSAFAEKPVTGEVTFDSGSIVHLDGTVFIKGTKVLTNVVVQTAAIPALVTNQTAAITATAAVQGVLLDLLGVDGSTNSVLNPTNVVVTVLNGDAVVTNLSVTVPGVTTNVVLSR